MVKIPLIVFATFDAAVQLNAQAVVAVVALIVGAFFTVRQLQFTSEKRQLDLYDKRFKIYQAVLDFLAIASTGKVPVNAVISFDEAKQNARFLFKGNRELLFHLEEIRRRAEDCNTCRSIIDGNTLPREQQSLYAKRIMENQVWLGEQPRIVRAKLARYLSFD
jgi:hypothetical protein